MVERQLRRRGIRDERVLEAMARVPRHRFVPLDQSRYAYDDCPLPIAGGQTISQPYMVAYTLAAAVLAPTDHVLDVGTGCGYAAAVASLLVARVESIERIPGLAEDARALLDDLGYGNVTVHLGDGSAGLPEHAPFDAIVCAAAAPRIPTSWKGQLAPGGRIVAPVGSRYEQHLVRATCTDGRWTEALLTGVRYVPLIGAEGFTGS